MFHHVSLGLDYIHTFNPPIIHRDIKPLNILCRFGKYLISDFDIAETVDNSYTLGGTNSYMPPELWQGGDQTTGIDIYKLGVTIIEALDGFPDLAKRPATWQQWHHYLQTLARERPIASMLASSPDERPTAH
jgi:serine/threonine protein kinase